MEKAILGPSVDHTTNVLRMTTKDLVLFRHIFLAGGENELPPASFHRRWSDLLVNSKSHVAIEAFRESAKTQLVIRTFPLFSLMYPGTDRDYIVLIKANQTQASAKLKEIEIELTTNPVLMQRVVKINELSQTVLSVDMRINDTLSHNVRIEAYGKGASIRGLANIDRRPSVCIIDDPQDNEDARSDTILDTDWDWFLSDVMFLGKATRIFMIGNNLGDKCIIERVFANAQQLGFMTERIPAITREGKPSWPEKFSLQALEKERESYFTMGKLDTWMRERMCEATSEETRVFHSKDIRYFSINQVQSLCYKANVYLTIDPASSREDSACFRAIVVNAVQPDGSWMIVDVPYGRWSSDEFIEILFNTVRKYRPLAVGIEKGEYKQIIEPFILKEMPKRKCFFNIVEIEHAKWGSKLERVKMLSPRFKSHTIWFPDKAPWVSEMENELAGVTKDGFKSAFVDLIDALSMAEQLSDPPYDHNVDSDSLQTVTVEG